MKDNIKLVVDRIDAEGKPVHIEWLGKFDGRFYPSQGDSTSDDRSYRKMNDYTYELINRKDGKAVRSGVSIYSQNGKVRTNTVVGRTLSDRPFTTFRFTTGNTCRCRAMAVSLSGS